MAEVLTRRDGPAGYPRIRGRAVARLLRQARFPDLKTFEQLDWEALRGVDAVRLPVAVEGAHCDVVHVVSAGVGGALVVGNGREREHTCAGDGEAGGVDTPGLTP